MILGVNKSSIPAKIILESNNVKLCLFNTTIQRSLRSVFHLINPNTPQCFSMTIKTLKYALSKTENLVNGTAIKPLRFVYTCTMMSVYFFELLIL